MALRQPTKISAWDMMKLIGLLVVSPTQFEAREAIDNASLEHQPEDQRSRAEWVRTALSQSLLLVVASAVIGSIAGYVASQAFGRRDGAIAALQVIGVAILLWATLAVRGWEVQSMAGVTLGERVNRWIFRSLYCIGTVLLVLPVVWFTASQP